MRILWVKAGKILPVDTGGRIRSFNILRHLAERNDTAFLSYYGGQLSIRAMTVTAAVHAVLPVDDGTGLVALR